jgi:hypothetical protein
MVEVSLRTHPIPIHLYVSELNPVKSLFLYLTLPKLTYTITFYNNGITPQIIFCNVFLFVDGGNFYLVYLFYVWTHINHINAQK